MKPLVSLHLPVIKDGDADAHKGRLAFPCEGKAHVVKLLQVESSIHGLPSPRPSPLQPGGATLSLKSG